MAERTDHFEQLSEPQKRGQATEAIVKAELVTRDIPVLIPEYDNESYDFVIEPDGRFFRLQAKTGYETGDGTITFETVSTRSRSDGYVRSGYAGEIDYFIVYSAERGRTYLVHIDEAAKGKCNSATRHQRTISVQTLTGTMISA